MMILIIMIIIVIMITIVVSVAGGRRRPACFCGSGNAASFPNHPRLVAPESARREKAWPALACFASPAPPLNPNGVCERNHTSGKE